MRKFLKYFIVVFALFTIFETKVNAISCTYEGDGVNYSVNINKRTFTIDKTVYLYGSFSGQHKGTARDDFPNAESILNWGKGYNTSEKSFGTLDFDAKNWFLSNLKCPPYSILIDREWKGYQLTMIDDEHLNEFENFAKTRLGYALMPLKTESEKDSNYTSSCVALNDEKSCENDPYFACIWNEHTIDGEKYSYCNTDKLLYVSCGSGEEIAKDIPYQAPKLTSFAVNLLKIATPIILIIVGMISLIKALVASKEEDIKKAQSSLVKKLIAAALIFFVVAIVQFIMSIAADSTETKSITSCIDCFISNNCDKNIYYKTNINGREFCTPLGGESKLCNPESN